MAMMNKPRFAAQLQNMPMAVTAGLDGFCISHIGPEGRIVVPSAYDRFGSPMHVADPQEAYRIMREAQGATAALLAGVFGRAVS